MNWKSNSIFFNACSLCRFIGQRINMTLQNFARVPVESTGGVTSSDDLGPAGIPPHVPRPRVCYQLAVIKVRL